MTEVEGTSPNALIGLAQAEEHSGSGVVAIRTKRDQIVAQGEEAVSYLQGQLSQNVENMAVGETARTLLLQPQGKVDSWMRVFRAANDIFWLDTDAGYGSSALERLERFKLRTKLTLELTTVDVVALRGPESDATAASFPSAVAVDADWSTMSGVDLFSAEHQTMPHEIPEGPAEALELLRIRSGQPAMGSELGTNTIPAAAHIVDESVDFTKGCYVGQELVARIDSRGSATPKRLCSFTADSPVHDVAGPLLDADDAEIGEISSAAAAGDGSLVGLAYIKRAVDVPCTARATSLGGATMDVTVTPLPRA